MRSQPVDHQDPGVQPERTLLSWARTSLLLVVVAGFLLRWVPYHGPKVLALFLAALAVSAGISLTHRRRLISSTRGIADEHYIPAIGSVTSLALGVVVLGLAAMMLLLTS